MGQSDTPQGHDNTADRQTDAPNSPALSKAGQVIPSGPAPVGKHSNSNQPENSPPLWKKLDTWRFVVEIAVLLVALKVACIYSDQLDEMRATTQATQTAAGAAYSAAQTAKQTLEASNKSFRTEQRAYIFVTSYNISNPPRCNPEVASGARACADIHFVNGGKTPAIGVRTMRYAFAGGEKEAEKLIMNFKAPEYKPRGSIQGSGAPDWATVASNDVGEQLLPKVIEGSIPLFVYGVIQYRDIFGEYHETGFCAIHLPKNGPFLNCGIGNWLDNRPEKWE